MKNMSVWSFLEPINVLGLAYAVLCADHRSCYGSCFAEIPCLVKASLCMNMQVSCKSCHLAKISYPVIRLDRSSWEHFWPILLPWAHSDPQVCTGIYIQISNFIWSFCNYFHLSVLPPADKLLTPSPADESLYFRRANLSRAQIICVPLSMFYKSMHRFSFSTSDNH